MNQKLLSKILATMLVMTLSFANFILLGVYASKTYATSDELENQGVATNNENVEFDAYFTNENGKKVHTLKQDIAKQDKLYLLVNIKKGYLKNANISVTGETGQVANFKIADNSTTSDAIQNIDADNNKIYLKQLNSGTQVVLEVPIACINNDLFDLSHFSKINNIKLTGSYVSDAGKTVNLEKTVNTRNEWSGAAKEVVEQSVQTYIPYQMGNEQGTILQTLIKTGLEENTLPIEQTSIHIKVPEVNGQKPEKVIVTVNSTKATNGKGSLEFGQDNWSYDPVIGLLNITVKNEAANNLVSWNKDAKDEYVVTYVYEEKVEQINALQDIVVTIKAYNSVTTLNKKDSLEIRKK